MNESQYERCMVTYVHLGEHPHRHCCHHSCHHHQCCPANRYETFQDQQGGQGMKVTHMKAAREVGMGKWRLTIRLVRIY